MFHSVIKSATATHRQREGLVSVGLDRAGLGGPPGILLLLLLIITTITIFENRMHPPSPPPDHHHNNAPQEGADLLVKSHHMRFPRGGRWQVIHNYFFFIIARYFSLVWMVKYRNR